MPLPISVLIVTVYNYHFHCSPKHLQPCLILVFKVAVDVYLRSMPKLISCKTYGVLYKYTHCKSHISLKAWWNISNFSNELGKAAL